MGMKILNSYRLSDFYEHVDDTMDIYSKILRLPTPRRCVEP